MKNLKTLPEFREVLTSGSALVITDSARSPGAMFHPDPAGCSHVQEHSFEAKVITNAERNGSYFAVQDLREAREHWPEIPRCRSSACSSA